MGYGVQRRTIPRRHESCQLNSPPANKSLKVSAPKAVTSWRNGYVNSAVRGRGELSLMLIRNPNVDRRGHWLAITAVLSIFTLAVPAFAQQRAPAPTSAYAPSRCANPVAPTSSDAIDRAVVVGMLRSRCAEKTNR